MDKQEHTLYGSTNVEHITLKNSGLCIESLK